MEKLMEVVVENGDIQKAIIQLRRKVERSGFLSQLKRSSFFSKQDAEKKVKRSDCHEKEAKKKS